MGSATVPVAVFGVAPKTLQQTDLSNDDSGATPEPAGGTPALPPIVHRKMNTGKESSRAECARLGSRLHCVTTRRVASTRQGVRSAPPFDFRHRPATCASPCEIMPAPRHPIVSAIFHTASPAPRCPSGIRAPFRAPSKIAQPFMAGTRGPQISKVPSGTKEPFCRPSRDFSIWLTPDPAINGWAIVVVSLRDFAPWRLCVKFIRPNRPSQNEYRKRAFPVRNAECGMRRAPVFAPVFTALRRGELLRRGKECGIWKWGARPSRLPFSASRRKPFNQLICPTMVRARRPNPHAGRTRSPQSSIPK
jgi:hypothetical protein